MGCLNKVFRVEIDMAVFREAERTRLGFGGVKMTGAPLPQCKTSVERAYDGYGDAFTCVKTSSTGLALVSRPGLLNDTEGG